jgi:hypothetical protein
VERQRVLKPPTLTQPRTGPFSTLLEALAGIMVSEIWFSRHRELAVFMNTAIILLAIM